MSDSTFNYYLKKFADRYKLDSDFCGCYFIRGMYGKILPYDLENQLLGVWAIDLSTRKKKSFLARLSPYIIKVHQDADDGFGAYFLEDHIDAVVKVIQARRKHALSVSAKKLKAQQAIQNFGYKN